MSLTTGTIKMTKKRAIDRKREAAVTIELCDPDDKTHAREMFSVSGGLYMITDKGIYLTRLADDIDPGRTNMAVGNAHKKILEHGFENETIGRILLLALRLFDKKHLEPNFDCDGAIAAAFEATKLLIEMQDAASLLKTDIDLILERGLLPDTGRSQNIPTIKSLDTRINTYAHKADQVRDIITGMFKLIYGTENGKKVLENIEAAIVAKHGESSDLGNFFGMIKPTLIFTRNIRNAVVHPKNDQRFIILDFNPNPDNTVDPPTVELAHPDTPQPKMLVTSFVEQMSGQYVDMMEFLIFHLCLSNLGHLGKFEHGIMEMPSERRRHKDTKFTYAVKLNGSWQPLG